MVKVLQIFALSQSQLLSINIDWKISVWKKSKCSHSSMFETCKPVFETFELVCKTFKSVFETKLVFKTCKPVFETFKPAYETKSVWKFSLTRISSPNGSKPRISVTVVSIDNPRWRSHHSIILCSILFGKRKSNKSQNCQKNHVSNSEWKSRVSNWSTFFSFIMIICITALGFYYAHYLIVNDV